ncbi:hypothetical protein OAT18_03165 [Tenacibaculum sp.]|nr:hypothetical protein [Tenacibaculum sp.]
MMNVSLKDKVIFTAILLLIIHTSKGQDYKFEVTVWGKKIGTVLSKKKQQGNEVIYTSNSRSEINFFGKKVIETNMKVVYKDSILQNSFHEVVKNGKVKEQSTMNYENKKYTIVTNGKTTFFDKPIKFSTIMLTYDKPKNGQKVFEEAGGFYKSMAFVEKETFKLINPESRHKDEYIYNKDGVLEKCVIKHTLANIIMELKP